MNYALPLAIVALASKLTDLALKLIPGRKKPTINDQAARSGTAAGAAANEASKLAGSSKT